MSARRHNYPATRRPARPHIKTCNKANLTGVVGITLTTNRGRLVYSVAPSRKKFNIRRLGKSEAWRQAVAHRAAHEDNVAASGSSWASPSTGSGSSRKAVVS